MDSSYGSSNFLYIKESKKERSSAGRKENKYQDIISNLTDKLSLMEEVKKDVEELKNFIFEKEGSN